MALEETAAQRQPYVLGRWRIDPGAYALSDGARTQYVEPRAMAVLDYLAANHGRTVSREELLDAIWKTRFVVEETLTRCISQLRQIFEDDPRNPTYIQTIPKLGYRLLVAPQPIGAASPAPLVEAGSTAVSAAPSQAEPGPSWRAWIWSGVAIFVAAAFGIGTLLWWQGLAPLNTVVQSPASPITARPTIARQSVAILPFNSFSTDSGAIAFADGMTEELIQLLSRVPDLKVPSRTSAFYFRDHPSDLKTIANLLGVAHVLEGSVRQQDTQMRITVQLIDARSDSHLWTETIDAELVNVLEVQRRIATTVAQKLNIALGRELWPDRQPATTDMAAYQSYVQARALQRRRTGPALLESIDLYKAAVERDPRFAPAWTDLALIYWVTPAYIDVPDEQIATWDRLAKSSAHRALELDPYAGIAHVVLADAARSDYRWVEGEQGYRQAFASTPGDALVITWYADMLVMTGRIDASLQYYQLGMRLDPLSPIAAVSLARANLYAGRYQEVRHLLDRAQQLGFDSAFAKRLDAYLHLHAGDRAGARKLWSEIEDPAEAKAMIAVVDALGDASLRPSALVAIEHLPPWRYLPLRGRMFAAGLLGAREEAWRAAEQGLASGLDPTEDWWLPESASIRTDPRFPQLLEKMNLLPYWHAYGWADACRPEADSVRCR